LSSLQRCLFDLQNFRFFVLYYFWTTHKKNKDLYLQFKKINKQTITTKNNINLIFLFYHFQSWENITIFTIIFKTTLDLVKKLLKIYSMICPQAQEERVDLAQTFFGQGVRRRSIFRYFVRTSFMDGPLCFIFGNKNQTFTFKSY